eukprot:9048993-Pyramimonas_sp.AAC.1
MGGVDGSIWSVLGGAGGPGGDPACDAGAVQDAAGGRAALHRAHELHGALQRGPLRPVSDARGTALPA